MSFTIGVVTSIIGTAALVVFAFILRKAFLPWVQRKLSGQIDISGKWYCRLTSPSGNPHQLVMTVTQRIRHIEIEISAAKTLAAISTTEAKVYQGKGELRDGYLTISTRNVDHHAIGVYVLLLQVMSGGKILAGCGAWHSVTANKIQALDFQWTRIADQNPT